MKHLLKYVILVMAIMFWLLVLFIGSNVAFSKPQIPFKVSVSGRVELGTDLYSDNCYGDIDLGLNLYIGKFKNYSYAGSRTWFLLDINDNRIKGYPFREIYYIGNKLSIKGFFVDVQHFCNHAIYSSALHRKGGFYTQRWFDNRWGENMTTISVGYEFEFSIYTNKYFTSTHLE